MIFNEVTHKVDIDSMNKVEADVYIWFLRCEMGRHDEAILHARSATKANTLKLPHNRALKRFMASAVLRHHDDIQEIDALIIRVKDKYGLPAKGWKCKPTLEARLLWILNLTN